jgi:anti-sigma regulatory factor (Ser/Thr protein kinase)
VWHNAKRGTTRRMEREQRVELPPWPSSARDARRFVARALETAPSEARDVSILLASELVTNALLYARGRIVLRVTPTPDAYRISVHDSSPGEVVPRRAPLTATSGRGLALVDQLCASWGVDSVSDEGKDVWFEVPRS